MQGITVAIGKAGIDFFTQEILVDELLNLLSGLKPPDRNISVGHIDIGCSYADGVEIILTNGSLQNFSAAYQSVAQQSGGIFMLAFNEAKSFSAFYNWEEKYEYTHGTSYPYGGCDYDSGSYPVDNKFTYNPAFSGLSVNIPLQFEYDRQNQKWSFVAGASTGRATSDNPNIPSGSVLESTNQYCFKAQVSDATIATIEATDFNSSLNKIISGTIAGIAGSGDLGGGIVYDFSIGDAGILFPKDDGIQMAVKGGASYNGNVFTSNTPPPSLPFPLPPTDTDLHHLNMYVSNYEIDALNWAYTEAGKLDMLIKPEELPDPQLLKVSSYVNYEPSLQPYAAFAMNAEIKQNAAPVTSFQTVWLFGTPVLNILHSQLPSNVYTLIQAIAGNAYTSKTDLENFLTQATVPNQYFSIIENAAKNSAMVLTQDITYTLTILNNASPAPDIVFSVKRTDVLTNLSLGISTNNAQSLQFGFMNADNFVTYKSSSIPGFNGPIFESIVWVIAESLYAQNLSALGKTGVPLPIMQNFQFDFGNASLSLQNGYVSILANIVNKPK